VQANELAGDVLTIERVSPLRGQIHIPLSRYATITLAPLTPEDARQAAITWSERPQDEWRSARARKSGIAGGARFSEAMRMRKILGQDRTGRKASDPLTPRRASGP
jgi:hypothetical protein